MEKKLITDPQEILQKLDAYLKTSLTPEEIETEEGFKKIAAALLAKGCNNYDLEYLNIDLRSFEELARDKKSHEVIFHQKINWDFFPDDSCARQQPNYG